MTAAIRPIRSVLEQRAIPLPIPPSEQALRAAARAGFDDGERFGYIAGWKYGTVCGLCLGVPLGGAAIWAALELGRMWGA